MFCVCIISANNDLFVCLVPIREINTCGVTTLPSSASLRLDRAARWHKSASVAEHTTAGVSTHADQNQIRRGASSPRPPAAPYFKPRIILRVAHLQKL